MTEREALRDAIGRGLDAGKSFRLHCEKVTEIEWRVMASLAALATPAPVAAGEGMVMVERAELEDYCDVIGNLIGELTDPGSGALAAHYRIKQLLSAPAQSPVSEGAEIEP